MEKISVFYHLAASAGAEADYTLLEVPAARKLKSVIIDLAFPIGTYGELEINFKRGIRSLLPTYGVYSGDGMIFPIHVEVEWDSAEPVVLHYKNLSTTQVREAYIHVQALLYQPEQVK